MYAFMRLIGSSVGKLIITYEAGTKCWTSLRNIDRWLFTLFLFSRRSPKLSDLEKIRERLLCELGQSLPKTKEMILSNIRSVSMFIFCWSHIVNIYLSVMSFLWFSKFLTLYLFPPPIFLSACKNILQYDVQV